MEQGKDHKLLEVRDVINTEGSRINYLRGLIRIAESDNDKSMVEIGYIDKIAEIIGASHAEIWQAEKQQENNKLEGIKFTTKQQKVLFLIQALYLCWLDDDYSDAEREEIIAIGNELEINLSEIEQIEAWIKQGIEWMRSGAELIGIN